MSENSELAEKTNVYCYVKHYTHSHFFDQLFTQALPNHSTTYFTDNLSLFIFIRYFKKRNVKLIPFIVYAKFSGNTNLSQKTISILRWESTYMKKPFSVVENKFLVLKEWFVNRMNNDSICFCWSGNNTESHAFGQASKELNNKIRFGEITNYPHTVYLDKNGTNYYSGLVNEIHKSIKLNDNTSASWISELKKLKQSQKHIPQASLKNKIKLFITLYGIQQYIFGSGKRFNMMHMLLNKYKPYSSKLKELIDNGEFVDINELKIPTSKVHHSIKVLVPLQVNHDTQLHVFSHFKSSFDYIQYLLSIIDDHTELHIKLHPAENKEINKLTEYIIDRVNRKYNNVKLIKTFSFANYDCVATMNSTFGIDALLADCKVITFGQSLYSDFDFVLLYKNYTSIRDALAQYENHINPDSFKYFAYTIQSEFYNFNYFGDSISKGISAELFNSSIRRLQKELQV